MHPRIGFRHLNPSSPRTGEQKSFRTKSARCSEVSEGGCCEGLSWRGTLVRGTCVYLYIYIYVYVFLHIYIYIYRVTPPPYDTHTP